MMNPYEKYKQQMVTTMTQADMLLRLYDETIRQIEIARNAIAQKDIAEMDKAVLKAQRILQYLQSCLNLKYDVSGNLKNLYQFFEQQLVMANIKKDSKPLNDIEPLIRDLRDTFNQCARLDRADRSSTTVPDVV